MLFTLFILVAKQREHNGLEQHLHVVIIERHQPTQTGNILGFTLQQKEQVGVDLHEAVVRCLAKRKIAIVGMYHVGIVAVCHAVLNQ